MRSLAKLLILFVSRRVFRQKHVFMVSHMRSGTSVLSNIILTDPSFYGVGEAHIEYHNNRSLGALLYKIASVRGLRGCAAKYVYDKILHNERIQCDMTKIAPSAKFIIVLRNPVDAIPSIAKVMEGLWQGDLDQQALVYYEQRIKWLSRFADKLPVEDFFFLEYEELLERPRPILDQLQRFLCLDHSLRECYEISSWVGRSGIGDPSDRIKSGKLIARRRRTHDELAMPDSFKNAYRQYSDLRAVLITKSKGQNA